MCFGGTLNLALSIYLWNSLYSRTKTRSWELEIYGNAFMIHIPFHSHVTFPFSHSRSQTTPRPFSFLHSDNSNAEFAFPIQTLVNTYEEVRRSGSDTSQHQPRACSYRCGGGGASGRAESFFIWQRLNLPREMIYCEVF